MKNVYMRGLLGRVVRKGQEKGLRERIVLKGCEGRSRRRSEGDDCCEGL